MRHEDYKSLKIRAEDGIASVTIDHPPMNLLDPVLFGELERLVRELEDDDDIRVVVFGSADPDYFIAHYDVQVLLSRPPATGRAGTLKPFHALLERYRTLPKVTIARIEGRARGGGSEFALALDLRFGAIGSAILGQFEVGVGLLPGGAGTQRLTRLLGRSRALEVILGGQDVGAERAEQYGWINKALASEEIGAYVDHLAHRIAAFPAQAVQLAKRSVDAAERLPDYEGLLEEAYQPPRRWRFVPFAGVCRARSRGVREIVGHARLYSPWMTQCRSAWAVRPAGPGPDRTKRARPGPPERSWIGNHRIRGSVIQDLFVIPFGSGETSATSRRHPPVPGRERSPYVARPGVRRGSRPTSPATGVTLVPVGFMSPHYPSRKRSTAVIW
jgi:enoyl-CoA hydratase/carnithine racemase